MSAQCTHRRCLYSTQHLLSFSELQNKYPSRETVPLIFETIINDMHCRVNEGLKVLAQDFPPLSRLIRSIRQKMHFLRSCDLELQRENFPQTWLHSHQTRPSPPRAQLPAPARQCFGIRIYSDSAILIRDPDRNDSAMLIIYPDFLAKIRKFPPSLSHVFCNVPRHVLEPSYFEVNFAFLFTR
jgi:hypothetical protein